MRTANVAPLMQGDGSCSLTRIVLALATAPVEDGRTHEGEAFLRTWLAQQGEQGVLSAVQGGRLPEAHFAGFLRLLGRIETLSARLRDAIVGVGLSSLDVDVRDATVQAIEGWNDAALVRRLVDHDEPVGWLHAYAAQVASDVHNPNKRRPPP